MKLKEKCTQTTIVSILVLMAVAVDSSPIVNGQLAAGQRQQQFPFAVSFGSLEAANAGNSSSFSHFCGGSIIRTDFNSSWAISSAHCFPPRASDSERKEIFAVIGGGDLLAGGGNEDALCSVQTTFVADFDQYSFQNDIALVKIDCGHQQVIELSPLEPLHSGNTDCVIYGYGAERFDMSGMKPSSALRYGSVQPISYSECAKVMGRVAAPLPHTGQFCARGGKPEFTDACSGDSGSAMICRNKPSERYKLIGIISYGMGCGSEYSAGVYQSIFHHRRWIDLTIQHECQIDEAGDDEEAFN